MSARTLRLAALLLIALTLVACVQQPEEPEDFSGSYLTNYAATQATRTPSIADTGQLLTDPDGSDALRRRLGTPSLIGHKVVFADGLLQIDCTFSPATSLAELTEARRFAREKLLLQQLDELDPGYYDRLLGRAPVQGAVTQVVCRLFIGDTLVLQDNWEAQNATLLSYENTLPVVALREAAPALLSAAAGVVKANLPAAQLSLQCSVTDRALLVQIKTDRHIDPDLCDQWREPLARELAQRAVNSEGVRFPVLVVQYYAGSSLYCEDVCLYSDGVTTWLGEADWSNLPQVQQVLERPEPPEKEPEESEPTEPETEPETQPEAETQPETRPDAETEPGTQPSEPAQEPSAPESAPTGATDATEAIEEPTSQPAPTEPEPEIAPFEPSTQSSDQGVDKDDPA